MFETLIAAVIAFVSTNIDDLVINLLFFAQSTTARQVRTIVAGKYLGIGVLVLLSLLGACGMQLVPTQYIGLLGLIPIVLGVKEWLAYRRQRGETAETERTPPDTVSVFGVMSVTAANGADNIGVYIPLFAGYGAWQMALTVVVFALMTALWCLIGRRLASFPALQTRLTKYKPVIVPVIYVALGIYIILKSYLPG